MILDLFYNVLDTVLTFLYGFFPDIEITKMAITPLLVDFNRVMLQAFGFLKFFINPTIVNIVISLLILRIAVIPLWNFVVYVYKLIPFV